MYEYPTCLVPLVRCASDQLLLLVVVVVVQVHSARVQPVRDNSAAAAL
jgi:hypothetical protein